MDLAKKAMKACIVSISLLKRGIALHGNAFFSQYGISVVMEQKTAIHSGPIYMSSTGYGRA